MVGLRLLIPSGYHDPAALLQRTARRERTMDNGLWTMDYGPRILMDRLRISSDFHRGDMAKHSRGGFEDSEELLLVMMV